MAYDIGALIAGTGGITPPKFDFQSAIGNLPNAYWDGLEQAYKQRNRDLFRDGVPTDASGNPDLQGAYLKMLQAGGAAQAVPALAGINTQQNQAAYNKIANQPEPPIPSYGATPSLNEQSPGPTPRARVMASNSESNHPDDDVPDGADRLPASRVSLAFQDLQPSAPAPTKATPTAPTPNAAPPAQPNRLDAVARKYEERAKYFFDRAKAAANAGMTAAAATDKAQAEEAAKQAIEIRKSMLKSDEPTNEIKNYNQKVKQGYKGTFDQASKEDKQTEARIAIDKQAAEEIGKQSAQITRAMPLLEEAIKLAKSTPGGWGGRAALQFGRFVSAFGLKVPEGASDAEKLNAISLQLLPLVRQPGQQSNMEMQAYLNGVPSLAQSAEGRLKAAQMLLQLAKRGQAVASVYRKNIGALDLEEKLAALDKPIFSKEQTYLLEQHTPKAGAKQAVQFKEGQTATNPETGEKRIYRSGNWEVLR